MAWLFSNLFGGGKSASTRDASDDFWYQRMPRGGTSVAGPSVTIEAALTLPVVADCLKVLQDTVASLPLHLYANKGDKGNEKAENHPLYDILHRQPNEETTAYEYWGQLVFDLATRGNHFSEVVPGARGPVDQLIRMNPDLVSVSRLSDGSRRFEVREPGKASRYLVEGEVWHLRLLPLASDGLCGTSPIWTGREAIGSALALQQYAARFFGNDATPPFVIKHPGNFKDESSKSNFLAAIKKWWGGANRGSPGVLEYGMDVVKLGHNNEEAQFLETRKEHNLDITRIWRVPPHKVGILDRATFSNIEHQSLEFVTDTILPIVKLIEQAISRDLIIAPQKYFAEFNLDGLLRGDLESRYAAYAIGRNWGWLTTNDILRKENMNPIEGGDDDHLQPMNMVPAGTEVPPRDRRRDAPPTGASLPKPIGVAYHGPSL